MVTHVMATMPYRNKETGEYNAKWIRNIFKNFDIKDWIVALETGKGGYRHYQIRFSISGNFDDFFLWAHVYAPGMHIEKANDGPFENNYERKDGFFVTSRDTSDILRIRFGRLSPLQRDILSIVDSQNDRQVDVWLDISGNHGKTWMTMHLWERGQALVVPRYATTAEKLSAFVCSAYKGEPYIIIDIPRAGEPSKALYEAIEEVKDGLVFDTRYSGRTKNVRGAKIIIFTNNPLDTSCLSFDRWRLHGMKNSDLSIQYVHDLLTPTTPPRRGRPVGSKKKKKGECLS